MHLNVKISEHQNNYSINTVYDHRHRPFSSDRTQQVFDLFRIRFYVLKTKTRKKIRVKKKKFIWLIEIETHVFEPSRFATIHEI